MRAGRDLDLMASRRAALAAKTAGRTTLIAAAAAAAAAEGTAAHLYAAGSDAVRFAGHSRRA